MKKLLYIANLRLPTEKAYGINISETCGAFADSGLEVTLVFPYRKNKIIADIFDYYGIKRSFKVKIISIIDIYLPGKFDRISVIIKSFISGLALAVYALWIDADIIYSRDEFPLFVLSFFKDDVYYEAHKFSNARRFFYRRFLRRKIKIITISESLKTSFLSMGFSAENVLVAHDGVNLKDFDIQMSKEEARDKTGLPQGAKIAMYTGHLFDWKGADILAMAAETLPDIKFIFVGGTEYDAESFKKKFRDIPNVIVVGHKPHKEIPVFLKAADILVLPNSAKDKIYLGTSPIKLFEYMASNRPIVASGLSSISEILNRENAVLVSPDDSSALADGIKNLIGNESFKMSISKKAFDDVQNYTWQKRAEKIINFIK